MPDDSCRPVVEKLAQALLDCATDDPALVGRTQPEGNDNWLDTLRLPPPRVATQITLVPPDRDSGRDVETEQLVAMAMAAAQDAAEAAAQANAGYRGARRQMWVMAGVAALGMALGMIGVIDHLAITRSSQRLAALTDQVREVSDAQQQSAARIDAVQTSMEHNNATEQAALATLQAREAASWSAPPPVNPTPVWTTPLKAPQPYGGNRPTSGAPAAWHTRYERQSQTQRAQPPVWLATIIHNVRNDFGTLFR